MSCRDAESVVADGDVTRYWNVPLEHRSRTESTTTVHVCHTAQFAGKVWQSQAIQAAENEHSEFELDPLWYSQPMQVTEQRCDVVGLSC